MDEICFEHAVVSLSIGEIKLSFPLFCIFFQLSFVFNPLFIKQIKVGIVKASFDECWMIIVNCADTIELIIMPLSFIGYRSIWIVKSTIPFHLVVFPFSSVLASFFVNELSLSVPHSIFLETFITSANVILFDNKAIFIFFLLALGIRYDLVCFNLNYNRLTRV